MLVFPNKNDLNVWNVFTNLRAMDTGTIPFGGREWRG